MGSVNLSFDGRNFDELVAVNCTDAETGGPRCTIHCRCANGICLATLDPDAGQARQIINELNVFLARCGAPREAAVAGRVGVDD